MPAFALVDANNFYCSCERAFDPALQGLPVIVLSNNDGCVISRSEEAKELGVAMGAPWFQIEQGPDAASIRQFSSNYALYGDMSRRILEVLRRWSWKVEPYSIDEMFLDLSGFGGDLVARGHAIRRDVLRETKIPTCVGIGPSKTIAKLANHLAKQRPEYAGVCDLTDPEARAVVYPSLPVGEIWGVAGATGRRLARMGIQTVDQLAALDMRQARDAFTVIGQRLVMELRGTSCLPLNMLAPQRKGVAVTRSFSHAVTDWREMSEAVATYATRATEKLRRHGLVAAGMTVFMRTNRYNGDPSYRGQVSYEIEPTQDCLILIGEALRGARSLWRPSYRYFKAGVMLHDLSPVGRMPASMFPTRDPRASARIMTALDAVNARFGRDTLRPAVTGIAREWATKAEYRSPRYTTRIDEIMKAVAI
ncbi:MAG: Y-family DNA polymerase [Parvibaculaceae bacterium]|nr:Y-family DNA polymerase [Parvibaculaceae bacterium]